MRKTYIKPETDTIVISEDSLLAESNSIMVEGVDGFDGFGGVDETGSVEPASRSSSPWDVDALDYSSN